MSTSNAAPPANEAAAAAHAEIAALVQRARAAQEAIAHTLAYDARVMGDYSVPTATAARVAVPTLILTGGASFDLFKPTAEALVAAMPDARTAVLDGQEHNVDPAVLGTAMAAFLKS